MKHLSMKREVTAVRCKVQVTFRDGKTHSYIGLFKSTSEAAIDAFEKFGMVKVDARKAA